MVRFGWSYLSYVRCNLLYKAKVFFCGFLNWNFPFPVYRLQKFNIFYCKKQFERMKINEHSRFVVSKNWLLNPTSKIVTDWNYSHIICSFSKTHSTKQISFTPLGTVLSRTVNSFAELHNDAFFQNFYGATWIGKRSPFFYHFGIAYSPLWRVFAVICGN